MKIGEPTLAHVQAALAKSGYDYSEITAAFYSHEGTQNGEAFEIHRILFVHFDELGCGNVFIDKKSGKAEF